MDCAAATTLLDLPPSLITRILQQLKHFPDYILNLAFTCKAACQCALDDGLWAAFCDQPLFTCCKAWNTNSYRHLWIRLLLPYGHLIGSLWHCNVWPGGQIVYVDAEPPRLVARSLYFSSLNDGPRCHDIFAVELPQGALQCKAQVTCWRDRHSTEAFENPAELKPLATTAKAVAATQTTSTFASGKSVAVSSTVTPAAACADSSTISNSNSTVSSTSSAALQHGFILSCSGGCTSIATEFANKRFRSKPYWEVRKRALDRLQVSGLQQGHEHNGLHGISALSDSSSSTNYSGNSSQDAAAPLPDIGLQHGVDFIHFVSMSDMLPSRAPAELRPLELHDWHSSNQHSSSSGSSCNSRTLADAASTAFHPAIAAAGMPAAPLMAAAAAVLDAGFAMALPGLWRGTYGSHGVEVLQLQLLQVPAGFDLFNNRGGGEPDIQPGLGGAEALAADWAIDAVPGVLLHGLVGEHSDTTAGVADDARDAVEYSTAADDDSNSEGSGMQAQQGSVDSSQQQQVDSGAAAMHPESAVNGGSISQDKYQQPFGPLLLVATKLLGDVNVPVGRVTFAVDVGSRCTVGSGEVLHLPVDYHSDVPLNRPGVRELRVKGRYRGRAQIAFSCFEGPSIIAAELVVFDADCFGLLWKLPVESFSLFSRVIQLP